MIYLSGLIRSRKGSNGRCMQSCKETTPWAGRLFHAPYIHYSRSVSCSCASGSSKLINPLAPGCDDRGKPQIESLAGRPACCVYFFLKKKEKPAAEGFGFGVKHFQGI
jgi:hypothetical protein